MKRVKNIIDTAVRIKKGYNIFVKALGYAEKALFVYSIAENILGRLNLSGDNR